MFYVERVGDLSSASGDTISCNANLPEIFAMFILAAHAILLA